MKYFVVEGKSITTKVGIKSSNSEKHDEVEVKHLGDDNETTRAILKKHVDLGTLYEADKPKIREAKEKAKAIAKAEAKERSITPAKLAKVEEKVMLAESKTRDAEAKVKVAEAKVKDAEAKTVEAEDKTVEAEVRAEEAEAKVKELEATIKANKK